MRGTLSVGIIGCGEITAKRRASQFDEASDVDIGLAMDVVGDLATDIGERFDVPATTDEDDVLSSPDIDIVYIATPHHLHERQAIAAAEAGKHVLVEKPITVSLEAADAVIAACERNDVTLCVCEPARFDPAVRTAKELIDDGLVGELVGTKISIMARKPDGYWEGGYTGRVQTEWRKSSERSGGGILTMNAIHNIDALRYLTGLEWGRVSCEYDSFVPPDDVEDFSVAMVRYESGAIGVIQTSSFLQDGPPSETVGGDRIYGTEGELVVGDPVRIRTNEPSRLGEAETWHQVATEPGRSKGMYLIEEFTRAILTDGEPPVTGADGRKALELVTAAYRAGETGESVSLPLSD